MASSDVSTRDLAGSSMDSATRDIPSDVREGNRGRGRGRDRGRGRGNSHVGNSYVGRSSSSNHGESHVNTEERENDSNKIVKIERSFTQTFSDEAIALDSNIINLLRNYYQYHRINLFPRTAFTVMVVAHDSNFRPNDIRNCSYILSSPGYDYQLTTKEATQASTIYHLLVRKGLVAPYAQRQMRPKNHQ